MSTQQADLDGDIWFFTDHKTHKIEEIKKDDLECSA
jgi:general stress protein 26